MAKRAVAKPRSPSLVVLIGVLGQEARVLLACHEEADPHDDVHGQEGVVSLRQSVPRDRNALK